MAIIGGAVFPPLMGWLSHDILTIQTAMLVPTVAFVVILLFARTMGRSALAHGVARP